MTAVEFDEHVKKCVLENEYAEQPIQCKECNKICNSLQSYTAHKMFHDTKDLEPTAINEAGVRVVVKLIKVNEKSSRTCVCELCGKV